MRILSLLAVFIVALTFNLPRAYSIEFPPPKYTTTFHTVKKGENLRLLAGYYMLNPREWRKIYEWNRSEIRYGNRIYPGQELLIFINKKVRETIDTILANAKSPPVIIIFGDHGPRSELNWEDVDRTNHHESMSVLNALYLPGVDNDLLRPGLSPVNTFRIVFNEYFGQQYELLPDRSYYSMERKPYRFYDVTAEVRAGKPGMSVVKE